MSLSDTVGTASPQILESVFSQLIPAFPSINLGAHLHCKPEEAIPKLKAAFAGAAEDSTVQ